MPDILIRGMEMPKEGFVEVLIRDDGTVQQTGQSYRIDGTDYYSPYVGETPAIYSAVPVPPHGRLIDADALRAEFTEPNEGNGGWRNPDEALVHKTGVWAAIDAAPTIIPADNAEEE